jgi:hypothetical protein
MAMTGHRQLAANMEIAGIVRRQEMLSGHRIGTNVPLLWSEFAKKTVA